MRPGHSCAPIERRTGYNAWIMAETKAPEIATAQSNRAPSDMQRSTLLEAYAGHHLRRFACMLPAILGTFKLSSTVVGSDGECLQDQVRDRIGVRDQR
jgi:hypothetical protein